jgi:hypothetical protein
MYKLTTVIVAAAVAVLASGMTPLTASVAEAKTSNQIKNENKGKAAKAKSAAKSAARKSKSKR